MTTKLTLARVVLELQSMDMAIWPMRDGRYRVNFAAGLEDTAYYTRCLEDALRQARAMRREHVDNAMAIHSVIRRAMPGNDTLN